MDIISYWGHESGDSGSDRRSLPSSVLALTVSNSKYLKEREQRQDWVILPLLCTLEAIPWLWDFLAIDLKKKNNPRDRFFLSLLNLSKWFLRLSKSLASATSCGNESPLQVCFMGKKFFCAQLTWNRSGFKALGWGGLGVLGLERLQSWGGEDFLLNWKEKNKKPTQNQTEQK